MIKNLPAMQMTQVQSLGQKDPLEKGLAAHSSVLAWRIPWTEEPVGYSPWGHRESAMTEQLTLTYSRLTNNVVIASGGQQRDSATHTSFAPQTPLPSRLPRDTEQKPLCWRAGPRLLSVLNRAVSIGLFRAP